MKNQFIDLILQRLHESKDQLRKQFFQEHPIKVARHFALDNFLPTEIAQTVYANFPKPKKMHLLCNYGEIKSRYKHIKDSSSLLQESLLCHSRYKNYRCA